ncbi:MAG: ABC transporter substrate-binding protein [Gemmatimonadota bacterium]|nr:ABC transporter substrate-binding protein [Gemmatimonadota bacterium]
MRVLSLLPASTEIVAALGAGDWLVGISHECDYPPLVVRGMPRVTCSSLDAAATAFDIDRSVRARSDAGESLYSVDGRAIDALRPDLVITQALCDVCAVSESDVRSITARLTSEPAVVTTSGSTWNGICDDIAAIGNAMGRAAEASSLIESLDARLRAVHDTLEAARAPRPRVVVIEWTDPVFASGHWVPELVRRAGGIELMANAGDHSTVRSADEIRTAKPEILVVAPCGYDMPRAVVAARVMLARDEWAWARELPVWAMDSNSLLSRPGPRLVDGTETLAAIFNPALFPVPDAACACRVEVGYVR